MRRTWRCTSPRRELMSPTIAPPYSPGTITRIGFPGGLPPIPIQFGFNPNSLNLKSIGKWVSGDLIPSAPYTPAQIVLSSIRLNGVVPVDSTGPHSAGSSALSVNFVASLPGAFRELVRGRLHSRVPALEPGVGSRAGQSNGVPSGSPPRALRTASLPSSSSDSSRSSSKNPHEYGRNARVLSSIYASR